MVEGYGKTPAGTHRVVEVGTGGVAYSPFLPSLRASWITPKLLARRPGAGGGGINEGVVRVSSSVAISSGACVAESSLMEEDCDTVVSPGHAG